MIGICRVPAEDLVGEYASAIGLRQLVRYRYTVIHFWLGLALV